MNDSFDRLSELFMRFPGIGPRQAKRFVYFLLHANTLYRNDLVKLITDLSYSVKQCTDCFRFYAYKSEGTQTICELCKTRSSDSLLLCEKDVDVESLEKAGVYSGKYFILGGLVGILEKEPEKKIRQRELLKRIEETKDIKEIIIALSANTDGDNTFSYLEKLLAPIAQKNNIKITHLGRGLSTGTELEYSDSDTLRNALKNRS
jgi:recombination protein RecR